MLHWYCIMYSIQPRFWSEPESFIIGRRGHLDVLIDRKECFEPIEDEV